MLLPLVYLTPPHVRHNRKGKKKLLQAAEVAFVSSRESLGRRGALPREEETVDLPLLPLLLLGAEEEEGGIFNGCDDVLLCVLCMGNGRSCQFEESSNSFSFPDKTKVHVGAFKSTFGRRGISKSL